MKTFLKRISMVLVALCATFCLSLSLVSSAFAEGGEAPDESGGSDRACTSILTFINCDAKDGEGIMQVIRLTVNILSGGIYLAASIGIILCGVKIITARDDPQQVAKARKRIIEIIIGVIAWVLIEVLIVFIIPGGDTMGIGANG